MTGIATIAIEYRPGEFRAAAIDADGQVLEFRVERIHARSLVGGVYLGRVRAVRPEIGAAFIDIGLGDDAFLNLHRSKSKTDTPIDSLGTDIVEGAAILVQIDRDPTPGKSARLTLKTNVSELPTDTTCPQILAEPSSLPVRALGDWVTAGTEKIIVDDVRAAQEVHSALSGDNGPEIENINTMSAFEAAGIDEVFEDQLSPVVQLPGGGLLIIERTNAMTTIDVNVGQGIESNAAQLILNTNIEAAEHIARALRLRNIGGLIAVDFLKMSSKNDNEQVVATLREALSDDPAQAQTSGMSGFGVVEIARRQVSASIPETFLHAEYTLTSATLALNALNDIRKRRGTSATITSSRDVIAELKGALKPAKTELEAELGFVVQLETSPNIAANTYSVT